MAAAMFFPIADIWQNQNVICAICNLNPVKYTCPRCNISYCSVDCYKNEKHVECSENFYRENVMTELTSTTDEESKQKMYEILTRFQNEQDTNLLNNDIEMNSDEMDSDDEDCMDLSERLENVDLNNPDAVWEKLNNDERQQFEALVNSGQIAQFIPNWTPWWCLKTITAPIQDLDQPEDFSYVEHCPKIKEVPDFNVISNTPPSECVQFNIVNVLASFVYTMKTYNGEHYDYINESVYLLIFLSNNLKNGKNYEDPNTAMNDIIVEASHCFLIVFDEREFDDMKVNCKTLIKGPSINDQTFYIQAALSEIHKMLVTLKRKINHRLKLAKEGKRSIEPDDPEIEIPKEKLNLHIKKIEYYMSYIKSFNLLINF
ncbi:zinc finger HIT domain-containing protein 2 [Chrysoperla carnea]|uniref:zinc finger HIT domain-containing protein 2 n=1 Tax=Chrysoperla carnea TaxID=189513 RepID=UPI001D07C1FF|nr:zinc finger HIT domain-containing protein 2 [Chrysoperla carnea]